MPSLISQEKTLNEDIGFFEKRYGLYFKDREMRRTIKNILNDLEKEKKYILGRKKYYEQSIILPKV